MPLERRLCRQCGEVTMHRQDWVQLANGALVRLPWTCPECNPRPEGLARTPPGEREGGASASAGSGTVDGRSDSP
jgi:hypothetical protein